MTKLIAPSALANAVAVGALALACAPGIAQTVAAAGTAGGASDILQEVVVTAEFRSEKLQQTPLAITALSGDALESKNILSLQDVSQAAPNVQLFENNAAF